MSKGIGWPHVPIVGNAADVREFHAVLAEHNVSSIRNRVVVNRPQTGGVRVLADLRRGNSPLTRNSSMNSRMTGSKPASAVVAGKGRQFGIERIFVLHGIESGDPVGTQSAVEVNAERNGRKTSVRHRFPPLARHCTLLGMIARVRSPDRGFGMHVGRVSLPDGRRHAGTGT